MKIINAILTKNPCYYADDKIVVKGLMIHSVGCSQPKASVFVKNWNRPGYNACVHGFIDGNTGDIYQTLPWNYRGWHAGGSANNTHIGIEMCEPSTIKYTGGSSWIETGDGANTKETVMRTYNSAVELFAYLCKIYNLDPMANGVIISHSEGYKMGIASNHGDVEHIWNKFGLTMSKFRKDIKTRIGKEIPKSIIKSGDIVKITSDAMHYYNGKTIPKWIKDQKWIVESIEGDKAIINKNIAGIYSIMSPINIKYLTITDAPFKPYLVKVNIDNLNMRTGPATTCPSIGYVPEGVYTITKLSGKWGRLKSKQKYDGKRVYAWIYTDYTTKL